jgi:hypothetical protein
MTNNKAPTAFISYSWEDDAHRIWVCDLATRLQSNGVAITLDQWHAAPGDQLSEFMERAVRENDHVLIICTPHYKKRSDGRIGGVGYEGDIMTAEALTSRNQRKFIPILRKGDWRDAAPSWVSGKYYVDLSGRQYSEACYQDLLLTLLGQRRQAPPLGPPPPNIQLGKSKTLRPKKAKTKLKKEEQPIKIEAAIVEKPITPRMDEPPLSTTEVEPANNSASLAIQALTNMSRESDDWDECVFDEDGNCINDNQKHWGANE